MSGALRAERVSVAHAEILSAVHARCFEEPWSPESMSGLLTTPGTIGVIATRAGAAGDPLGLALMRMAADEGEILTIGVLPESRTQGIGTFLLGILMQERIKALFLDVAADNANALGLYERVGFDVVGRRPGYYKRSGGPPVDSLTMKCVLR